MDNPIEEMKKLTRTIEVTENCCEQSNGNEQENNSELSISPLVSNQTSKEIRKRIRYFSETSEKNSQISDVSATTSYNTINDNEVWYNYKFRTHVGEQQINEQYRYYNKHPEDHPSYAQEWESFWAIRCNNLSIEGQPNYDLIRQEWIPFWIVRLKYLELLEIAKFRSTIWENVRSEISSRSMISSSNDERNSYRFRRIQESPPRQRNKHYPSSRRSSHKDYHRERSPKQDRRYSKDRDNNRSRSSKTRSSRYEKHDKEISITVVSCCCEILGIAEVSECIRTQITSLLVLALDYEKYGMHSEQYKLAKDNMEFFKIVRDKIKESLEAGHITSKRSNVIEDIIENISILINKRSHWRTLDKNDAVIASLTSRCISPIRAPTDALEIPDATCSSPNASPTYSPTCSSSSVIASPSYSPFCSSSSVIASPSYSPFCSSSPVIASTSYYPRSPVYSIKSDKSEISIKKLPKSSNVDLSEDIGTISSPIIGTLTEESEKTTKDRLKIVRSSSVISLTSSDSATMPPGVSDYELEVMKSEPPISVSSQDSTDPVEVQSSCEDTSSVSTVVEDTTELVLNNDTQDHENMTDLTDDDLKYLLKNFKQLTDDEQKNLITFLEKIDHPGNENRIKELYDYVLKCEEDSEESEADISDLSSSLAEPVECVASPEVVEHQEVITENMSDNNDIIDPPILTIPEKKQWKPFKVTLNVEDSLRKVYLIEDKDTVIDAQMQ